MHVVFVIPGIMGTELYLPRTDGTREKVWPPSPLETQLGYRRREKLASPQVVIGGLITRVLCFDFYQPLLDMLDDLGFTATGTAKRLVVFPYDWRRDLFDTANLLAASMENARQAGATRISLVGHSMGGLIGRIVLESGSYTDQPWFPLVDQFLLVATPHFGAPLALGRVLGIDSALGFSGEDFAWLADHLAYPSAYQLLPSPGEQACWDQSDPTLGSLDIYQQSVAQALGLNAALLVRARAVHLVLDPGNPPSHVRYFYFGATGHRTATRVNVFRVAAGGAIDPRRTSLTRTVDGGDGTVPMFSALPRRGQRHIVVNEHATAFKGNAFRRVFVRLLGGNEGDALEAVPGPALAISIETPVATAGADIEVLLYSTGDQEDPADGFEEIRGEFVLEKVGDRNERAEVRRIPVAYDGPRVNRLRVYLAPLDEPGHYLLRFEGIPSDADPAPLGICAPLPNRSSVDR